MPNDIYQWEAGGGLVHHCPICFKPLTTPQSRSRCLGDHVEWCKLYHTQLFKKGTSSQCDPCRRSDEERTKRHREIAEKIHELKQLKAEQIPTTPLTPRAINRVPREQMLGGQSPTTKKERKAAKRAQKVSEMTKVVSLVDIDFVSRVLQPSEYEMEDIEIERQLLHDPEIKLNRGFHRGTSNTREIRTEIVKKDRRVGKDEVHISGRELDGLLQLLDVSPTTTASSAEEKAIVMDLRKKIEEDLIHMHNEKELTMMRKAGFWRWASKKAYKRLLQNGRIWHEKDSDSLMAKSDDINGSSTDSAAADAETESTEPDTDTNTPSEEDLVTPKSTLHTKAGSTFARSPSKADAGWTRVGRLNKVKTPVGNLKLSHNGGLAKLESPTSRRRGFYSSVMVCDTEP